jgi:folate-binding protein YgfZ
MDKGRSSLLQQGNVDAEFDAATGRFALADSSMLGKLDVSGNDALDLLHRISTNSLTRLPQGRLAPTVFLTEKGRIIDRVTVMRRENGLLLFTSPGMQSRIADWIARFTITEQVQVNDITDDLSVFSLMSVKGLSGLVDISFPPVWNSAAVRLDGIECFSAHVQLRNVDCLWLMSRPEESGRTWSSLGDLARRCGGRIAGSGAVEAFRITQGIPAGGKELSDSLHPLEVNLRNDIDFTKGCYIGQEVVARMETYQKVRRRLAGLILEQGEGTHACPLFAAGKEIGLITSRSPVEVHGKVPGLAVVRTDVQDGQRVEFRSGEGGSGTIVSLPIVLS